MPKVRRTLEELGGQPLEFSRHEPLSRYVNTETVSDKRSR